MVRSRFVLIFVALGATSIAAAAPLRLASIVAEPASQEAASCARYERDTPESGDPQDCSKSGLNVSPGEHNNVLDMNSFPSTGHDSSGIVSLPPFLSPSSQERVDDDTANVPGSIESLATHPSGPLDFPLIQEGVDSIESRAPYQASTPFDFPSIRKRTDADDTDSAPSIESHALHPSGPFELVRRSIGVLSPGTPHAPNAHSLLRKRTDTEIASAHDPDSPIAFRSSVPRQPTSAFSTSSPSTDAASLDQREDSREEGDVEKDTVVTAHSIASWHDHSSPGLSHPSPASVGYLLLRERTSIDTASAHIIESRAAGKLIPAPPVVSNDMMLTYHFISELETSDQPHAAGLVRNHIKHNDITSYEKATKDSTKWSKRVVDNYGWR
ncbi:hypothetical protein FB446DRAFT_783178 [Lentinula raphanica]|nr:hypothetical protein FB446DRAFT_783178 [Lentinula raphanica]